MAELIMRKVLDRLGVVLLLKVRVIVVSAQQSGAVQFFRLSYDFALPTEMLSGVEVFLKRYPGRSTGYPALPPQVGSKAGAVLKSPFPTSASTNPACGFPALGFHC